MKKFAALALSLSLFSTAASAVIIDVSVQGIVSRINCGAQVNLAAAALSEVQKGFCRQFFETAAQAGGGGAGAGAGGAAAGAFGLGGAGTIALAALGIALVAGFGGSSDTTTGSE